MGIPNCLLRTRNRRMVTAPDRVLLTGSRSILVRPGDEKRMPSPSSTGRTYTRISPTSPRRGLSSRSASDDVTRARIPSPRQGLTICPVSEPAAVGRYLHQMPARVFRDRDTGMPWLSDAHLTIRVDNSRSRFAPAGLGYRCGVTTCGANWPVFSVCTSGLNGNL